jgi:hypothetical protein
MSVMGVVVPEVLSLVVVPAFGLSEQRPRPSFLLSAK